MRKYFVVLCVAVLAAGVAYAVTERNTCREDHGPPPTSEPAKKIGEIAGYRAFGLFVDGGGYGTDQDTLDEIEALNSDYQENEFDPRQSEADGIYEWLNSNHEIDDGSNTVTCPICGEVHTMSEYEAARDAKVDRLNELSSEIDDEWAALTDTIRAMVSDSSYKAFLDAQ